MSKFHLKLHASSPFSASPILLPSCRLRQPVVGFSPVVPSGRNIPSACLIRSAHCAKAAGAKAAGVAGPVKSGDGITLVVTPVKATVTVASTGPSLLRLNPAKVADVAAVLIGEKAFQLQLVSAELDPTTGKEKEPIGGSAHRVISQEDGTAIYEASLDVPDDFGAIGAILVTNQRQDELYLQDVKLETESGVLATFECNSWIQPASSDNGGTGQRIFFSISSNYLPDQTPEGLRSMRQKDLEQKRGDGTGERQSSDRIYDYDVYNDLGDPDSDAGNARPVLGGSKEYPYPRRCRTGRPPSKKDPKSERRRSGTIPYVPRDEQFSQTKQWQFNTTAARLAVVNFLSPHLQDFVDSSNTFNSFYAIDNLFEEGYEIPTVGGLGSLRDSIPWLARFVTEHVNQVVRFDMPELIKRNNFSWLKDEEFARQTLAGVNPYAIELVKEFPLKSKLDPATYGPPESAITAEVLEKEMSCGMSVKEAVEKKRLFMLDYHDLLLPYVHKVRAIQGTTLYGSRTLFFLGDDGMLRPVAIELTRPKSPTKPQWKQVFTPSGDGNSSWLWLVARTHALAHDSGVHQLVTHWLRTHCSVEPYIIAANRQLSEMHPIYRLLHPHFRYTMEINALARDALINAGGIIESSFSPAKYSMELSSVAYAQSWRFDMEALPADLIRRGMAVADPKAEHGLRLVIDDYPFAQDGLLIWSAIENWVRDYVSHYYHTASAVATDAELQSFWTEVRTKGHADKQSEPWWPKLDSPETLVQTLTTIIWVASAHHAAVNFGQYIYGGYFPNRPSIARLNMPTEDATPEELQKFHDDPGSYLLKCFPSKKQATLVMAVLDLLSTHAPDEEYLGWLVDPVYWDVDPEIKKAYDRFSDRLNEIEGIIDRRNSNPKLKHRSGAGVMPYELLKPFSGPGATGKGIPGSISI